MPKTEDLRERVVDAYQARKGKKKCLRSVDCQTQHVEMENTPMSGWLRNQGNIKETKINVYESTITTKMLWFTEFKEF